MIRCSLMFIVVAAVSIAHPASANLITNGGFETGDFTGWTTSTNPEVGGTAFGIPPHSGSYQAILRGDGFARVSQTVATIPEHNYIISFWLADFHSPTLFVVWDGHTIFSLFNREAFPYTEFTFDVRASGTSTTLQFDNIFSNGPPSSGFVIDDVSVVPGIPDSGSTASLLGFTLLGLASLRRKLSC
jgi:VPDSG-CTERM motif